jgi:hypothetical protein
MLNNLPLPVRTTNGLNEIVDIVARHKDGRYIGVIDGDILNWFNEDGTHAVVPSSAYDLRQPPIFGRVDYDALPDGVKGLMELTFTKQQKIAGIKALRQLLGLGIYEAKCPWERLKRNQGWFSHHNFRGSTTRKPRTQTNATQTYSLG